MKTEKGYYQTIGCDVILKNATKFFVSELDCSYKFSLTNLLTYKFHFTKNSFRHLIHFGSLCSTKHKTLWSPMAFGSCLIRSSRRLKELEGTAVQLSTSAFIFFSSCFRLIRLIPYGLDLQHMKAHRSPNARAHRRGVHSKRTLH